MRISAFTEFVAGWSLFTCFQLYLDFLVVEIQVFLSFLVRVSLPVSWLVYLVAYFTSPLGYCTGYSNFKWSKLNSWVLTTPLPTCTLLSFPHISKLYHYSLLKQKILCGQYLCGDLVNVCFCWGLSLSFIFFAVTNVPFKVSGTRKKQKKRSKEKRRRTKCQGHNEHSIDIWRISIFY